MKIDRLFEHDIGKKCEIDMSSYERVMIVAKAVFPTRIVCSAKLPKQ
jgi:hypothetical protein